jgi:hypothetical protein
VASGPFGGTFFDRQDEARAQAQARFLANAAESARRLREQLAPEQFDRARAAADRFGASLNGLAASSRLVTLGMTAAGASLLGFARAGLQGTVQGEMLKLKMQLLSQQVASVFLPTLDKLTGVLDKVTARFREMDGAQQAQVRRWGEAGVAAAGLAGTLAKVHPAAGLAAGALALLFGGTERGRESLQRMADRLEPTLEKAGELAVTLADKLAPAFERMAEQVEASVGWLAKLVELYERLDKFFQKDVDKGGVYKGGLTEMIADVSTRFTLIGLLSGKAFQAPGTSGVWGMPNGGLAGAMAAGAAKGAAGGAGGRRDVSPMGGPVTDVMETWRRIQAAVGQGPTAQEKTNEWLQRIHEELARLPAHLRDQVRLPPAPIPGMPMPFDPLPAQ